MAKKIILSLLAIILHTNVFAVEVNIDTLKTYLPSHFSGQVYIKENGVQICNYFQGFSDRLYGKLINDSTYFNLGEITHSFVYYFVEHLVSLNQIKLADSVQKYIPNFPYDNITIQHLLNHQSGLPSSYVRFYHKEHFQNIDVKIASKSIRFDNEDITDLLAKMKPQLHYEPGDSVSYSDMNYLLLTTIIENTTFTLFKDFSNILFKYQNVDVSPFISADTDLFENKAYGYRYFEDNRYELFENLNSFGFPFSDGTNGNQHLYLSAKNLSLWGQFLFNKMDQNSMKLNPNKNYFGNFKYDESLNYIFSEGAFGGTYSYLIYVPKTGFNIAITSNVFYNKNEFDELISWLVLRSYK